MVEGGTYGGDQQPANWRSTPTAPPARKRASLQTGHMHDLAELIFQALRSLETMTRCKSVLIAGLHIRSLARRADV
jgi:hypothetical protein